MRITAWKIITFLEEKNNILLSNVHTTTEYTVPQGWEHTSYTISLSIPYS